MLREQVTKNELPSILDMDATSLAKKIKNKHLTSYEVVSAYIDHIYNVNPALNAVVEDRFTDALQEAKAIDEQHATIKGPLHGVPMTIKESFDVKGMKTTGGLIHRQDLIIKQDSEVVKRLRRAGAIILGKTNTPTLCYCQETDNKVYGQTNNPWDVTRSAGGSSGGEGAILASGGAAVGLGSDIGGSIRFPSHLNGVVGFKSGMNQIPQTGHFPLATLPLQQRMLGFGPMGKSVRDMELLYKIIARDSPVDQTLQNFYVQFLPITNVGFPLSEETKNILIQIKEFLSTSFPIREETPPYFNESAQLWQEIMSLDGGKSMKEAAFIKDQTKPITEYMREKMRGTSQYHKYFTWALFGANLFRPSNRRIKEIETIIHNGDQIIKQYLRNRLLIFPVYHSGARVHGKLYKELFSIRKTFLIYMPYVAYANVWGLPSLVIPVATDADGMPISIQIMSTNGNETALFKLGTIIEKRFQGYVRSTNFDA
ncbi:MAG TPA: amidase [Bacillota bacterium]|nr:amidase [Bacillota bacterium]